MGENGQGGRGNVVSGVASGGLVNGISNTNTNGSSSLNNGVNDQASNSGNSSNITNSANGNNGNPINNSKDGKNNKLFEMKSRTCPLCRQDSRFTQIKLGCEPAFLKTFQKFKDLEEEDLIKFEKLEENGGMGLEDANDSGNNSRQYCDQDDDHDHKIEELNYIFNPCGHMTTEETAKYWSEEAYVLQGTTKKHHVCPFCLVVLNEKHKMQKLFSNVDL